VNRMQHHIQIACAPAQVYDYASTPALWPEWHPASLRLEPGADRPLTLGETFEEDIKTAGRDDHLSWKVTECEPGRIWAARAISRNHGARIFVRYRFAASNGGTAFQRELEYELPNVWLRLLNLVLLSRRIDAESRLSLQQLKQRAEANARRA